MLSCKIYSCFYFLKRNSIYFSFLSYQKSIYYSVLWLSKFSLVFYKNKVLNISSLNFHNKIQLSYGYNIRYGTVRYGTVRYGALEISDNNGLPTVLNFLMNLLKKNQGKMINMLLLIIFFLNSLFSEVVG